MAGPHPALPYPAPPDAASAAIRKWFDEAALARVPEHDDTISTARRAAQAYASRAKANNTRRACRAGVRAWCAWCDRHALPCLLGRSANVVAFLASERGRGLSVGTVDLRRAAIRYRHFAAGCPVPTVEAQVAEKMAAMRRHATELGEAPSKKVAATAGVLRDILAAIPGDLPGLRDRTLLLVGFAGALRRAELAAMRVAHLQGARAGVAAHLASIQGGALRQGGHRCPSVWHHRALSGQCSAGRRLRALRRAPCSGASDSRPGNGGARAPGPARSWAPKRPTRARWRGW